MGVFRGQEQLISRFEEEGEEVVRQKLGAGLYGPNKRKAAEYWLDGQERTREADISRRNDLRNNILLGIAIFGAIATVVSLFL